MERIELPPAKCGCGRWQMGDKTICAHEDATCPGKKKAAKRRRDG